MESRLHLKIANKSRVLRSFFDGINTNPLYKIQSLQHRYLFRDIQSIKANTLNVLPMLYPSKKSPRKSFTSKGFTTTFVIPLGFEPRTPTLKV